MASGPKASAGRTRKTTGIAANSSGAGATKSSTTKASGAKANGPKPLTNEELLSVWSKAVDTQMHFNEMAVKSRQLGLTFVAAALGTAVVLLGQGKDFSILIGTWRLHITVLLLLAALAALVAVRTLDLGVYHQMLRGAVAFGRDLEQLRLAKLLGVNKGMTDAIAHFSRSKNAQATGSPMTYTGAEDTTAGGKIATFYNLTTWFLVIAAGVLFLLTNWATVETPKKPAEVSAVAENNASPEINGNDNGAANDIAAANRTEPATPTTNAGTPASGNHL